MLVSSSGGVLRVRGFGDAATGDARYESTPGDVLLARRTRRRLPARAAYDSLTYFGWRAAEVEKSWP